MRARKASMFSGKQRYGAAQSRQRHTIGARVEVECSERVFGNPVIVPERSLAVSFRFSQPNSISCFSIRVQSVAGIPSMTRLRLAFQCLLRYGT
jgi:hypothetical protein